MISYNSIIEKQDIELLEKLGFKVINPNQKKYQEGCEAYSKKFGKDKVMTYFENIIKEECDMIAFRSLPNNQILSGVAAEVKFAKQIGYPIIELPCSLEERYMDYSKTKNYLMELGFYKYQI